MSWKQSCGFREEKIVTNEGEPRGEHFRKNFHGHGHGHMIQDIRALFGRWNLGVMNMLWFSSVIV